jgi:hypothetical protein
LKKKDWIGVIFVKKKKKKLFEKKKIRQKQNNYCCTYSSSGQVQEDLSAGGLEGQRHCLDFILRKKKKKFVRTKQFIAGQGVEQTLLGFILWKKKKKTVRTKQLLLEAQ